MGIQILCPGCQFIIKCKCKNLCNRSCKNQMTTHKLTCNKFWQLDNIDKCIHQWCLELSEDRYSVWLLNKKYEMTFFYSVGHNAKEPWLLSLDELRNCIFDEKKS